LALFLLERLIGDLHVAHGVRGRAHPVLRLAGPERRARHRRDPVPQADRVVHAEEDDAGHDAPDDADQDHGEQDDDTALAHIVPGLCRPILGRAHGVLRYSARPCLVLVLGACVA